MTTSHSPPACPSCGALGVGGLEGGLSLFGTLGAREFEDPAYWYPSHSQRNHFADTARQMTIVSASAVAVNTWFMIASSASALSKFGAGSMAVEIP